MEEAATLRESLAALQSDRSKEELTEASCKEQSTQHLPGVAGDTPQLERGVLRQRHPNSDFLLADLFDYALKDDGASMQVNATIHNSHGRHFSRSIAARIRCRKDSMFSPI